jgi:hypothetical protein
VFSTDVVDGKCGMYGYVYITAADMAAQRNKPEALAIFLHNR